MAMMCEDCEWYAEYEGVCCNADSKHCADYIDGDRYCEKFEAKSERMKGDCK